MKNIIKKIIKMIYLRVRYLYRMNILMTLFLNFRTQPLKKAICLPIHVFGRLKIHSLSGDLTINAPIQGGMIKIGYRWLDLFPQSYLPNQLFLLGEIIFSGRCIISGGVGLFVQRRNAQIEVGDCVTIGGGTFVKSMCNLTIGTNTRITGNCTIMNSNMHYVKNIKTGEIQRPWEEIIIGNNCWINSDSKILKGAVIPDYSIAASDSYLNRDYSSYGTNLFLVGSPAIVKTSKVQRIFSTKKEIELTSYFIKNPDKNIVIDEPGIFIDNNEFFDRKW